MMMSISLLCIIPLLAFCFLVLGIALGQYGSVNHSRDTEKMEAYSSSTGDLSLERAMYAGSCSTKNGQKAWY